MPSKKILCVGLVCVDLVQICKEYPNEDTDQRSLDHRWQRGGNASNNCTVLAKCGQECEYFGTMGTDIMAKYAKQDFEKNQIAINNIISHSNFDCPFSSVIINATNGSRTITHSNKNMPELTLDNFKILNLKEYLWIHFEGRNVKNVTSMLSVISEWNVNNSVIRTSVELEKPREELTDLLPLADVIFVGKDFATFHGCKDKQDALKKYIKHVKQRATVIVAWGDAGAIGQATDGEPVDSPAFSVKKVVDTLGAGDTFVAATILCLSKGLELQESIRVGCRIAGEKVGMPGFTQLNPGLLKLK